MAVILTSYYMPKAGGLCRRLFRAIDALLAAGHTVHYLAVAPFPIEHANCHFHRFPWPSRRASGLLFWGTFHCIAPLILLTIGLRHRVTHAFAFGTTYALLLQPCCRLTRAPLAAFLRADAIHNHRLAGRHSWLTRLESRLERAAFAGASVYPVSASLRQTLQERHPDLHPLRIEVFPNDRPADAEPGHPATGLEHVACIGVLEARKNQALAIQAIQSLGPHGPTLDLYGDGPDAGCLQALARMAPDARIRFHGWVAPERLWRNVDLLLMPSRHEGAPNAVLEAIAAGVPVLASDIPEHRELLPPDSLLAVDDPLPWAQAVRHLRSAPRMLQTLGRAQRERTRHLVFDWNAAIVRCIVPPGKKSRA